MLDNIGKRLIEKKLKPCPICKRSTALFVGETTTPYHMIGRAYIQCIRCNLTLQSNDARLTEQEYMYGGIATEIVEGLIAKWNSMGATEKGEK